MTPEVRQKIYDHILHCIVAEIPISAHAYDASTFRINNNVFCLHIRSTMVTLSVRNLDITLLGFSEVARVKLADPDAFNIIVDAVLKHS